ncbi:MAG: MaoC family dehydratase N-terminal domain-containing protein [Deltaproteobacteria bacterium]|nr:MaoC family dehydratase N-terminal domain-containing protein [Deltaproteobacteria bacterium]
MQTPKNTHKIVSKRVVEVEQGDIRRYADAIYAGMPIHHDLAAAKKAGYPGLVAPPTFTATLGDHAAVLGEMELNPRTILHSEQELLEYEAVCSGDVLNVTTTLVESYEKTGGSTNTGFVIVEDVGTNQKGKKVFHARRVFAIRGGFPRR